MSPSKLAKIKVRALAQGIYEGRHIDIGTVFDIDPAMYCGREDPDTAAFGWMEKVEEKTPLSADANISEKPKKKSLLKKIIGG